MVISCVLVRNDRLFFITITRLTNISPFYPADYVPINTPVVKKLEILGSKRNLISENCGHKITKFYSMKKVILSIAVVLACVAGASAQKQTGGEKNLEVQFAPLGGNPVSISGIRLRLFNSESSAIRIGFNVSNSSNTEITQEADADLDLLDLEDNNREFTFTIRPGYEKHFAGTDRLSPYVGAEILFSVTRTTDEIQSQWSNNDGQEQLQTETTTGGFNTFGINLVAGTDFYFADNIYLGAEIGFGFARTGDVESEVSYDNAPEGLDGGTSTVGNVTNSGFGANFQGSLRLGWLFN
jgi:hypothetical protein